MTERTMRLLIEARGDDFCEGEELTPHADYSGRGMMGRTTCALSFAQTWILLEAIAHVGFQIGEDDDREAGEWAEFLCDVRGMRFDSLGRGTIAY